MTKKIYPCYDCSIEPVEKPKGICDSCRRTFEDTMRKLDAKLHEIENGYL